jgi:hypothetical protein
MNGFVKMIRIGLYSTVVIISLAGCLGGGGGSTIQTSHAGDYTSTSTSPGASWVNNFEYGGNTYEAVSTGGVNRTIIKTGSRLKIVVDSTNCFAPAGDTSNDCPRDIRRSQIRSNKTFSIGQDLRYNFTVEKKFTHGDANQGAYINFFEIKPEPGGGISGTCPTAALYVNPASNKLTIIQSLGNHCNGGVQQDVMRDIGTMKKGKNKFQVVTKQTSGANGYIKVFQDGVLIYQRNGKSSYNHSRPIKFWVGGYICCGKINELLSNGEPNHTFLFENLSSAVETAGQLYAPTIVISVKPVVVVTPEVAEDIGGQRFVQTVNNISYNTDNMFSFNKYVTFNFGPKDTDNRFVLGFTGEQINNRLDKPLLYGYRNGNTLFAVATDNGYYGYKDSVLFKNESTQYFIFNHKHQENPNLKLEFTSIFATAIADPNADVINVERSFALGFDAAAQWTLNKPKNEFLKVSVGQPLRIERGRIEFDTFIANIAPEGREIKVSGIYGKNYNKNWKYEADASYIVDRNNIRGNNTGIMWMRIKFEG